MTQEEFFSRYTYNIRTDKIGGGFGNVYKAKDTLLHRTVAIKVSEVKTTADGQKTFSLKDEFEALAEVPKHPNIANYEACRIAADYRAYMRDYGQKAAHFADAKKKVDEFVADSIAKAKQMVEGDQAGTQDDVSDTPATDEQEEAA